MPVRRDPTTKQYFFRTSMKFLDGNTHRVFGTPGVAGYYHDLAQTKIGAGEAERRAIAWALTGELVWDPRAKRARLIKEVTTSSIPTTATAPAAPRTLKELADGFLATYRPESKEREKREKRRILDAHLIPAFGGMTIDEITQVEVNRFIAAEL